MALNIYIFRTCLCVEMVIYKIYQSWHCKHKNLVNSVIAFKHLNKSRNHQIMLQKTILLFKITSIEENRDR